MARAIHFTHHLCRTIDPDAAYPTQPEWDRVHQAFPRSTSPDFRCCSHSFGQRVRAQTTTKVEQVTCRLCLRELESQRASRDAWLAMTPADYTSMPDHHELVKRAWSYCCKDRGVPSPLTDEDHQRYELARLEGQVKRIVALDLLPASALLSHGDNTTAASCFRDKLGELARELDPAVLELASPLLQRWMFVGDLLVHVGEAIDEAQKLVEPFARAMQNAAPAAARRRAA